MTQAQKALRRVSPSRDVLERREGMPRDIREAFDEIVLELQRDPGSPRVEDIGGGRRLYTHPSPHIEVTFEPRPEEECLVLAAVDWSIVRGPTNIFVSYAHEDRGWVDELRKFLRVLSVKIKLWEDSQLKPGADWEAEIRAQLAAARIGILLVSIDFLNSKFITEVELKELLLRAAAGDELTLTWILVSSCPWEEKMPFKKYNALHKLDEEEALDECSDAKKNRRLTEIAREFRRLLDEE